MRFQKTFFFSSYSNRPENNIRRGKPNQAKGREKKSNHNYPSLIKNFYHLTCSQFQCLHFQFVVAFDFFSFLNLIRNGAEIKIQMKEKMDKNCTV